MALFKTDLGVAERYLTLVDEDIAERFWTDLRDEYDSVVGRVLDVTGQERLLDETPACSGGWSTATRGSIRCRTCRSSCCGGCGRGARGARSAAATITDRGRHAQYRLAAAGERQPVKGARGIDPWSIICSVFARKRSRPRSEQRGCGRARA